MTCKECLYYKVCPLGLAIKGSTGICLKFKNKADFVEVVRCKDCKFVKLMSDGKTLACRKQTAYRKPTDFCSYGGRKDK